MGVASADEITDLLGDRADEKIVDRIAHVGASLDELTEAVDDFEYQMRFGESREPSSAKVEEIRMILEELPYDLDVLGDTDNEADEHEGLSVVDRELDLER